MIRIMLKRRPSMLVVQHRDVIHPTLGGLRLDGNRLCAI